MSFAFGGFLNLNLLLSNMSGSFNTSKYSEYSYASNLLSNSFIFLVLVFCSLVNLGFCLYKKSTSTPKDNRRRRKPAFVTHDNEASLCV
jgi:hypothetical protein